MARFLARLACAFMVLFLTLGCGSSPTSPGAGGSNTGGSNSGNNNCPNATVGPLGCAKGLITATIGGSQFTGGVPTGQSTYTSVAAVPSLGLPAQDFFVIQGTSADLTSLLITARAKVGTAGLGQGVIDPELKQPTPNNAQLQTRSSSALTGHWNTNITGGSGTITVNTVSTSGATGSFSFTMVPQAGSGASGTRVVAGTFDVTF